MNREATTTTLARDSGLHQIGATPRYWIGVVSRQHVQRGIAGGFAQLCHGKEGPLRRMRTGDWLVYYSPREQMNEGAPLQSFTALGRVTGDHVYPHIMSEDFVPFRRDVTYLRTRTAEIRPLIGRLRFITDPQRWGYPLRTGVLEIGREDFALIAAAMGVPEWEDSDTHDASICD